MRAGRSGGALAAVFTIDGKDFDTMRRNAINGNTGGKGAAAPPVARMAEAVEGAKR